MKQSKYELRFNYHSIYGAAVQQVCDSLDGEGKGFVVGDAVADAREDVQPGHHADPVHRHVEDLHLMYVCICTGIW